MLRRVVVLFAMLFAVGEASGCSVVNIMSDALVQNDVVSSANGRFTAVIRRYDIPDFGATVRADETHRLDPVVTALYENFTGARVLLAEVATPGVYFSRVLVPDSGDFLAIAQGLGGCQNDVDAADALVTVYDLDGSSRSITYGDVFTPTDLLELPERSLRFELRGGVVVLKLRAGAVERRIDARTATLLDPKTSVFPFPRVLVTPATSWHRGMTDPDSDACAEAWAAPVLEHLPTREFFARATHAPLPPFPDLALKARIRGGVVVDVLVSESGEVLCTRPTRAPFGLHTIAAATLREWRFEPLLIDGRFVQYTGQLVVRFEETDDPAAAPSPEK